MAEGMSKFSISYRSFLLVNIRKRFLMSELKYQCNLIVQKKTTPSQIISIEYFHIRATVIFCRGTLKLFQMNDY